MEPILLISLTMEERMKDILSDPNVCYANSLDASGALYEFRDRLPTEDKQTFDSVLITHYLQHSDLMPRRVAYELIPKIPLRSCIPTLVDRLSIAGGKEKVEILFCLGGFRDPSLFPTLEEYTSAPEAYAALHGMVESDPERTVPYLAKAFRHEIPLLPRTLSNLLLDLAETVGQPRFPEIVGQIYAIVSASPPRRFCRRFTKALNKALIQYNRLNKDKPIPLTSFFSDFELNEL